MQILMTISASAHPVIESMMGMRQARKMGSGKVACRRQPVSNANECLPGTGKRGNRPCSVLLPVAANGNTIVQTRYGNLPIKIVDGRAVIDHSMPAKATPSAEERFDSKLEVSRSQYLGMLVLAKDVRMVIHHPFTVQLSEKRSYTPDFFIWWTDGRLQVEEVKGSTKQKNARDSITRLHLAAAKLPMFDWRLTRRVRGQWDEKKVPG